MDDDDVQDYVRPWKGLTDEELTDFLYNTNLGQAQMIQRQLDPITNKIRNDTLEEIALEFDKMRNGGDTTASFAAYVRGLKK